MLPIRGYGEQAEVANLAADFDVHTAVERTNRIGLQQEGARDELGAHFITVDAWPFVERAFRRQVRLVDQRYDFCDVLRCRFPQILFAHPISSGRDNWFARAVSAPSRSAPAPDNDRAVRSAGSDRAEACLR